MKTVVIDSALRFLLTCLVLVGLFLLPHSKRSLGLSFSKRRPVFSSATLLRFFLMASTSARLLTTVEKNHLRHQIILSVHEQPFLFCFPCSFIVNPLFKEFWKEHLLSTFFWLREGFANYVRCCIFESLGLLKLQNSKSWSYFLCHLLS